MKFALICLRLNSDCSDIEKFKEVIKFLVLFYVVLKHLSWVMLHDQKILCLNWRKLSRLDQWKNRMNMMGIELSDHIELFDVVIKIHLIMISLGDNPEPIRIVVKLCQFSLWILIEIRHCIQCMIIGISCVDQKDKLLEDLFIFVVSFL